METVIENFINGNLTDAKKQARSYSREALIYHMMEIWGYRESTARVIAAYLKGQATFQEAADAQYADKQ